MSLESWKAEFYPVEASEVRDAAQAVDHAIRKWRGCLPSNLARHRVYGGSSVNDKREYGGLQMNSETCALCMLYYNEKTRLKKDRCQACPVFAANNGHPCDSQWRMAARDYPLNVKPMLDVLRAARRLVKNGWDPVAHWRKLRSRRIRPHYTPEEYLDL